MPNWCSDYLTVIGPAPDLRELRERLRGVNEDGVESELCFSRILPTPKRLLDGSRRWLDTADGQRALAEWRQAKGDDERRQVYGRHRGLWVLCLRGEPDERPGEGWYSHRLNAWSTKWECDGARSRLTGDRLRYEFLTAWSPPLAFVAALARRYRGLVFELTYEEPGNCFAGFHRWERGRLVYSKEAEEPNECAELLEDAGQEEAAAFWLEDDEEDVALAVPR